jgi:uroporphyrinogen decarboxylase
MISPEHMRQYVFPWHMKIVAAAPTHGKPLILHFCGDACDVTEDIIEDIGFDSNRIG